MENQQTLSEKLTEAGVNPALVFEAENLEDQLIMISSYADGLAMGGEPFKSVSDSIKFFLELYKEDNE